MLSSTVLLAGHSTRMGQLKQHVRLGEQTFLQMIVSKLAHHEASLSKKIFVGQSSDLAAQQTVNDAGGIWLINNRPEDGPLSSIRLALEEIDVASAMLLWPTDHPMIASATIGKLIEAHQNHPECIIVPSNGSRRGHPSIFPAWCRNEFFAIALEEGARKILQTHPQKILHVLTDDIWTMKNLNTPDTLLEAGEWLKAQEKS